MPATHDDGSLCVRFAETFLNCVIAQEDPEQGLDDPACRGHYAALKACCAAQGLIAIKLVPETVGVSVGVSVDDRDDTCPATRI